MTLALFGLGYLVLVGIAIAAPSPLLWGIHSPAFLSGSAQMATLAILIAGVGFLLAHASRRAPVVRKKVDGAGQPASPGIPGWYRWAFVIAWGGLCWVLRTRTYLLGDQALWITRLRERSPVVYSEPLSALTWRGYRDLLLAARVPLEPATFAILPVLCGLIASVLAYDIGRRLSTRGRAPWVAAFVLLCGWSQIYFGYIETYPLACLGVLLYLALALRHLRGEISILVVGLSLALSIAGHLACLLLVPSYVFLVARGPSRRASRLAAIVLPLGIVTAIFLAAGYSMGEILHPIQLVWTALHTATGQRSNLGAALLAPLRIALDLGNWLLLTALAPVALIASKAATRSRTPWLADPGHGFLAVAALSGAMVAAVLCVPGSPAQDWDLLTICALPVIVFGAASGLALIEDRRSRLARIGLVLLSTGSLLGFVWMNADTAAGVRRFETLMSPSSALSSHERAYGNEKLADYYGTAGDRETSLRFAYRALAADSANGRYWGKVGQGLYELGRYREAIPQFLESASRGGPLAASYFYAGYSYLQLEEPTRALPLLWKAVRTDPGQRKYWGALGTAFIASGDLDRGRAVWLKALAKWPDDQETRQAYRMVFGEDPATGPRP